jgi:hypothetical protein
MRHGWWLWLLVWVLALSSARAAEVDPQDKSARVLLLLPGGPLLVELQVTIDEQPFRAGSEKLLDVIIAEADSDHDGMLTWDEAKKSRALGGAALNVEALDGNKNGIVEKDEARAVFTALTGGNAFAVQGQAFLGGRVDGSQLQQLLDVDGNEQFSEDEIEAVPARLRSRDADDNELVTVEEIAGFTSQNDQNGARAMAAAETIVAIDEATDFKTLHNTLLARFGQKDALPVPSFKLTRALAAQLDANTDQAIDAGELAGLRTTAAPLVLDVALGTRSRLRDSVKVVTLADELKAIARIDRGADGKLLLDLIGLRIEILAPNPKPTPQTFAGQATAYMSNLDRDKNGYLETKEVVGVPFAPQFDAWDADGDGKLFAKEIRAALERADAPNWQKISVAALSQGSNLFTQLDENADGQLGAREIQNAAERLRTVTLERDEVMRLAIARGVETYRYLNKGNTFRPRELAAARPTANGPAWFQRMDTNGDGDVTPREFLGPREQFDKLDGNGDQVIEADEAK